MICRNETFSITFVVLSSRWGILQFSTDKINSSKVIKDPNWPVYQSLVEVYNAEKVSCVNVAEFCSVETYIFKRGLIVRIHKNEQLLEVIASPFARLASA